MEKLNQEKVKIIETTKKGFPKVVLNRRKDGTISITGFIRQPDQETSLFSNKPQFKQLKNDQKELECNRQENVEQLIPTASKLVNIVGIPVGDSKFMKKCQDKSPSSSEIDAKKVDSFSILAHNTKINEDSKFKMYKQETKTQKFDQILEQITQGVNNNNNTSKSGKESLISQSLMEEFVNETAKLKASGATCTIPIDKLLNILYIMEINIKNSKKFPFKIDKENKKKIARFLGASNACLVCFYIMTSKDMPKRIYLEDVINGMILCVKYQLENIIFPAFDEAYELKPKTGDPTKKLIQIPEDTRKILLDQTVKILNLLTELLNIQVLTDSLVVEVASMASSAFFINNIDALQPACLKMITIIFTRYEQQRKVILEQILALGVDKPDMEYALDTEKIHVVTALVLQLIQCVTFFPESLVTDGFKTKKGIKDNLIYNKYETAKSTTGTFWVLFLYRCMSKPEDAYHKLLFEYFIKDLILLINKPKWPATVLLLNFVASILVKRFSNKEADDSSRLLSLDYLASIIVWLREGTKEEQIGEIDSVFKKMKLNEMEKENGVKEEKVEFLQDLLLKYLIENGTNDDAIRNALHFYVAQWYNQAIDQIITVLGTQPSDDENKSAKKNKLKRKREDKDGRYKKDTTTETYHNLEARKKQLLNKLQPYEYPKNSQIDYNEIELITEYLTSEIFSANFNKYLKAILIALKEESTIIRIKVIKCLALIIKADRSLLTQNDIQIAINYSFLDPESQVRETAVDLIGKFIFTHPTLLDKYYELLTARILDTSAGVRKKVIKILKNICETCPDYPKVPEMCVKIMRRVGDDGGVGKLVVDVFQSLWFTPMIESLENKVKNIVEVVAEFKDVGLQWFEQLLEKLFKPKQEKSDGTTVFKQPSNSLILASKQIIHCLTENILASNSSHFLAYSTTLSVFAKLQPNLLIHNAEQLQILLSLKCRSKEDTQVISDVAQILSLVVVLIPKPDEKFLSRLEQDCLVLVHERDRPVVVNCLKCLGSVINNITRNFIIIRDCFKKYYGYLVQIKLEMMRTERNVLGDLKYKQFFKRALFVVGHLLRLFDFKDDEVIGDLPANIVDQVFEVFLFILHQNKEEDVEADFIKSIRSICTRHYELILNNQLKAHYQRVLTSNDTPLTIKSEVLINIQTYLIEEDERMMDKHLKWKCQRDQETIKKVDDVSSGMASTVIQQYSHEVLESYLNPNIQVRKPALGVVQLILKQGLVHPIQIAPYLICMSTDCEIMVSHGADKQMLELERKYPTLIHVKSLLGVKLSYRLQQILQEGTIIRGYRLNDESEYPISLNGYLYSLLQNNRQQRRGLVLNILNQFDQEGISLSYMLYLADNIAYFPYMVQDGPLFIIHHIDMMISVSGTNLLQSFREALIKMDAQESMEVSALDEDDDQDALLARLPEDTLRLETYLTAAQGCLLLLMVKQHLKDVYGLNDGKIRQYSPIESTKIYEKPISRKTNQLFNPTMTIKRLQEDSPSKELDQKGRKNLINEYLEFKQLMLKLDRDEKNNEDILSLNSSNSVNELPSTSKPKPKRSQPSKTSKTPKPKRKKRNSIILSLDEDSDPDFTP